MQISRKNLISAFFLGSSSKVIGGALKFFSTPLLLTYFGKANYGLIGLALSINVYMQIMELGFNTGNIRFISQWLAERNQEKIIKLIQSSMLFYGAIGLINASILVFLSFYCQTIFNLGNEQTIIFRKMLFILSISSFISWTWSISSQVLRSYEKIAYDELLNLISSILIFISVVITIFLELTLTEYFFLYGVSIVSIYPIKIWKCKVLNPKIKFKLAWDSEVFKEVLSYSLGIFSMSFFQFSASNLRPIIIGIKGNVSDVADYNVLFQITNLIIVISGSFMGILLPFVTKLNVLKNTEAQDKIAFDGTKYLSILIILMVFGLILVAEPLLVLYVGDEYRHLSFWLIIWSLTMLSYHTGAIAAIVLSNTNIKPLAYFSMFSASTSLIAAWFLVPLYLVGGAVISLVIYSSFQMLFYYVYYIPQVMNLNSLRIFIHSFIKPAIIGLISLLTTKLFVSLVPQKENVLELIKIGTIFSFIYLLLTSIFLFKPGEIRKIIAN